jgi:hypothetical protein
LFCTGELHYDIMGVEVQEVCIISLESPVSPE